MTEICECGFSEKAHKRRDYFKKQDINLVFSDGLKPCKKFKPKEEDEYRAMDGWKNYKEKTPQNGSPSGEFNLSEKRKKFFDERIKIYEEAVENTNNKDMEIWYSNLCAQLKTIKKIIQRQDKTFIKKLKEEIYNAQMYADMDEPEFWATSTISPKDAQKRANYLFEFMKKIDTLAGDKLR